MQDFVHQPYGFVFRPSEKNLGFPNLAATFLNLQADVCVCVCLYIYIYTYTHIHTSNKKHIMNVTIYVYTYTRTLATYICTHVRQMQSE